MRVSILRILDSEGYRIMIPLIWVLLMFCWSASNLAKTGVLLTLAFTWTMPLLYHMSSWRYFFAERDSDSRQISVDECTWHTLQKPFTARCCPISSKSRSPFPRLFSIQGNRYRRSTLRHKRLDSLAGSNRSCWFSLDGWNRRYTLHAISCRPCPRRSNVFYRNRWCQSIPSIGRFPDFRHFLQEIIQEKTTECLFRQKFLPQNQTS